MCILLGTLTNTVTASSSSTHEAYRLARQAYAIDPYNERGLLIYIATMVELELKNELFYLGHELVATSPKKASTWYAVGCYYWTCRKLEAAQKYLEKTTKMNRRYNICAYVDM